MKALKKYLGIIWMLAGPVAMYFLLAQAVEKISAKPTQDVILPWVIILVVFIPIAFGFCIFGWYAWKEEYEEENM